MGKVIDLTGRKFCRITVRERADYNDLQGGAVWVCDCDCGERGFEVRGSSLRVGNTKSCGCLLRLHVNKLRALHARYEVEDFLSSEG